MKYAVLVLIMLLCTGTSALAHENGYIIQADVNDERLVCVSEKNIISEELGIYYVESEEELVGFCENYSVEKYEQDCELELFDVPDDEYYSLRWDAPVMRLPDVWDYKLKLENVDVAVLDTGIAPEHEDFDYERIEGVYNMCAASKIIAGGGDPDSAKYKSKVKNVEDDIGHGTSVAGVIAAKRNNAVGAYGIADGVNLKIYKVYSADCNQASCIVMALSHIYEENPDIDVINISIGFQVGSIVENVIAGLAERGVIVVAAAGNDGAEENGAGEVINYPAGCEKVIGVGALDSSLTVASYSQHNESVDVAAPGTAVYTTYLDNLYRSMSGTSFASPYVAGIAALVKATDDSIDHDAFLELIQSTAQDKGDTGYDVYYGWGVISPSKIMDTLADDYGLLLSDESAIVSGVQTDGTVSAYTIKQRYRTFMAYAVNYDENGAIKRVQKQYIDGRDGEVNVSFEGIPDKVYWWDVKMQPMLGV